MAERYIHFSFNPLRQVRTLAQAVDGFGPYFKPRGLWFSVEGNDDGWKSWCEAEKFRPNDLARQTEIIFADAAKVLRLSTPEAIDQFTEEYVVDAGVLHQMGLRRGFVIDWPKLAESHDAIIISPYQYSRRMAPHCFWYYTWDCASGCVWNANAIRELRELPTELDRAEIKDKVNE